MPTNYLEIGSAQEFVHLRTSEKQEEYLRAAHAHASTEVWHEVIRKYPEMKRWVAQNKSVPVAILSLLSADSDWRVRHMVASKNKLPVELIRKLANDSDTSVRTRIAYNKNSPLEILEVLSNDPEADVSRPARERLELQKKKVSNR